MKKEHAAEYGVDADRVAIWGDSSGGHGSGGFLSEEAYGLVLEFVNKHL